MHTFRRGLLAGVFASLVLTNILNHASSPFSLNWGLKQAQWTSLITFLGLLPLTFLVLRSRYAEVVPEGMVPATYGIPQKHTRQAEEGERAPAGSVKSEQEEHNTAKSLGTSAELSPDPSRDERCCRFNQYPILSPACPASTMMISSWGTSLLLP